MKKLILSIIMLAAAVSLRAQDSAAETSEWLPSFDAIVLEGAFDITLVAVPESEAPKVTYDTKGSTTTKFRAEVKERVLTIRERIDSRRVERTSVTLHYHKAELLSISDAVVTIEGVMEQKMLDLVVSGVARLNGKIEVRDLDANITGHSKVALSGEADYLTLYISTASFDGLELETISARVNSQGGSQTKLWVTDRLEARISTNGTVHYKGAPELLRIDRKFLSGEVKAIE